MDKNEKAKERMKRYRAKKTKVEKDKDREKDRLRHATKLSEKTLKEKADLLKKRRQNYARKVAERKEEEIRERKENSYIFNEEFHNRERIKKKRRERTAEEIELDCVEQLIRRRQERKDKDEEGKMEDNLKAKEGMRLLKTEGRMKPFKARFYHKNSELEIWKIFRNLGPSYKETLKEKRPEIANKLTQMEEEEKRVKDEKEKRVKDEKEKKENDLKQAIQDAVKEGKTGTGLNEGYVMVDGDWFWAGNPDDDPEKPKGEWVYHPIDDDYTWVGEGDPPQDDHFDYDKNNWEVTEEDEQRFKEQREKWLKYEMEKMREEKKAYMKEYHRKKREALQQPIEIEDLGEKGEYEKLRDKTVKEFEKLKKESGLFDD